MVCGIAGILTWKYIFISGATIFPAINHYSLTLRGISTGNDPKSQWEEAFTNIRQWIEQVRFITHSYWVRSIVKSNPA